MLLGMIQGSRETVQKERTNAGVTSLVGRVVRVYHTSRGVTLDKNTQKHRREGRVCAKTQAGR